MTDVELFISRRPHRLDISISDTNGFNPDVLNHWLGQAIRAIITIDTAQQAANAADPNVR